MQLISKADLRKKLKNKKNIIMDISSKDIKITKANTLPRRLKHNSFDGGDYARTTMSSRSLNR
ncbi:MAG: hypothetical protein QM493_06400 [Sulfurovum sp.]